MPSRPSQSPAAPMTAQSAEVTTGHGDSTASTGAKKKPVPMYQAEPALSDVRTKRSQRGIGASAGWARLMAQPSSGRREEPCAGEPTLLPPLSSQTEHRKSAIRLGSGFGARGIPPRLLDSVQRVGDDPVPRGGRRELVRRREMTGLGLAAGAPAKNEALVVVARRTQRSLIVHARHVAVVVRIGGRARRHTHGAARDRGDGE